MNKQNARKSGLTYFVYGSSKTSTADLKSAFFMPKTNKPNQNMRKIIITSIVAIFLIAPFEKANAQQSVTYANFPTVQVLTGANAKLSFGIWRFEPFFQIAQYWQVFEEQVTISNGSEYYSKRFASMQTLGAGIKFRITNNDRVIVGTEINGPASGSSFFNKNNLFNGVGVYTRGEMRRSSGNWYRYYLGYVRKQNLSERTNIELSARFSVPLFSYISGDDETVSIGYLQVRSGHVAVGAELNHEISRNFYLTMQLMYLRIFIREWSNDLIIPKPNDVISRNLVNFSIGIHYHIPTFGGRQQATPRTPRQRVAPRHRALPCPPNQMHLQRSWDRPPSVFNLPSRL